MMMMRRMMMMMMMLMRRRRRQMRMSPMPSTMLVKMPSIMTSTMATQAMLTMLLMVTSMWLFSCTDQSDPNIDKSLLATSLGTAVLLCCKQQPCSCNTNADAHIDAGCRPDHVWDKHMNMYLLPVKSEMTTVLLLCCIIAQLQPAHPRCHPVSRPCVDSGLGPNLARASRVSRTRRSTVANAATATCAIG